MNFARQHVPGVRCWALEGTDSYGAGLAAFLDAAGERVSEVFKLLERQPPQSQDCTPQSDLEAA